MKMQLIFCLLELSAAVILGGGGINTSANQGYFDSYFASHSKVVALCYPDEGKATFADVDLDERCTWHR